VPLDIELPLDVVPLDIELSLFVDPRFIVDLEEELGLEADGRLVLLLLYPD
jgi:hypothetical protein